MKPLLTVLVGVFGCAVLFAQEPSPSPASPPQSGTPPQASAPPTRASGQEKPLPSFLIIGTIFNENALSFPGVQVRVRRSDEKKFRWETYTNSRGEFAMRVFPGYEYEVVTHAKNYQDVRKTVNAKADVQERLSLKLEPVGHGETAKKP